jgi:KaiC/GvpD/RAD55 family RecA-like ATPase
MITNGSREQEDNAFAELETQPLNVEKDSSKLLSLLVKFLVSTGNVLLVQGSPGSGKTTLAFELLKRMEGPRIGRHTVPPNRLYVSSRTSPTRLRKHFPWINEIIDSGSGRAVGVDLTKSSNDFQVSQADNILSKVLNLKHSQQRSIIVIDSWEGALRNTTDEGRRMLESAILSQPEESKVSVVLVSESEENKGLAYLVDGVVTVSTEQLEGRRIRTLFVNKLRGLRIQTVQELFTLDEGQFGILPETGPIEVTQGKVKIPDPIPHTATAYSTGSPDLDKLLKGGVRKGSSLLLDLHNSVSPLEMRLLLRIICANFVNQGGGCFIVPAGTISSENVATALGRCVGETALRERVRIAEFNPSLPSKEWRLSLKSNVKEDAFSFGNCWKELGKVSSSLALAIDFDKIVQVYGDDIFLPNLSEIGASIRDSGALNIGMASRPTKLREDYLRIVDYHMRMQNVGGTLVMFGVKPFTNVHGVQFSLRNGFPAMSLTEIV